MEATLKWLIQGIEKGAYVDLIIYTQTMFHLLEGDYGPSVNPIHPQDHIT